ncbi:hypothetical protein B0I37DRAFT_363319 [Chaetomium sp. MPI-CAGE-AT-0009]|nr:hypothetical protein B0I37DRAFT_363319 [Chaetomium sp. MPI-CAGE-AT-0009]
MEIICALVLALSGSSAETGPVQSPPRALPILPVHTYTVAIDSPQLLEQDPAVAHTVCIGLREETADRGSRATCNRHACSIHDGNCGRSRRTPRLASSPGAKAARSHGVCCTTGWAVSAVQPHHPAS